MGLQNTVTSAKDKYTGLLRASDNMIGTVKGKRVFSTDNHTLAIKGERRDLKKRDTANDTKLQLIVSDQGAFKKPLF